MIKKKLIIEGIPAVLWGKDSNKIFMAVHGNMSHKEDDIIVKFAEKAVNSGYQVLSFDLPEHGERKDEGTPCKVQNCVKELIIMMNYVKEDKFFKNSALTNELTTIIGQEKIKEIQDYIKNNNGNGYEVKLEPVIVNGRITGITLIQLMGQTKEEMKAVEAENESRKYQNFPERAGYGTGR